MSDRPPLHSDLGPRRLTEQEIEARREETKHDLKRMQERLRLRKAKKDK
jgi:hypothetical protein